MVVRFCRTCNFHKIKAEALGYSFCARENCYSRFSKCLSKQALARFLEQESIQQGDRLDYAGGEDYLSASVVNK